MDIDHTFSAPICAARPDGFSKWRSALADYARTLRDTEPAGNNPVNHSGGWFSRRDLHREPVPVMQWLAASVKQEGDAAVAGVCGMQVAVKQLWANINNEADWMLPHIHDYPWCGVLYVEPGDGRGGDTLFFNPSTGSIRAGKREYLTYRPRPGVLLVWPGHLLHMVSPLGGSADRITYAFNLVAGRPATAR